MPYIIGVNPVKGRRKAKKRTTKRKPATRKAPVRRTKKNPVAKKRTAATKRSETTMPKKRKARKSPATRWRTRTVTKYRTRARRAAYRVKRAARAENLDIKKILRGSIAAAAGMLIAKAAVNKLTPGGSETERWSWPNIAMAAGSSIAVAFALGAIFKFKKPTVAYIAVGGGALAAYKAFTCKLAPRWGWSESWFGADEEIDPTYLGADEFEVMDYTPGMETMGYIPGMGATMSPARLVDYNPNMGATEGGGKVVQYNPNMGQVELSPGRQISAYRGYTM